MTDQKKLKIALLFLRKKDILVVVCYWLLRTKV